MKTKTLILITLKNTYLVFILLFSFCIATSFANETLAGILLIVSMPFIAILGITLGYLIQNYGKYFMISTKNSFFVLMLLSSFYWLLLCFSFLITTIFIRVSFEFGITICLYLLIAIFSGVFLYHIVTSVYMFYRVIVTISLIVLFFYYLLTPIPAYIDSLNLFLKSFIRLSVSLILIFITFIKIFFYKLTKNQKFQ